MMVASCYVISGWLVFESVHDAVHDVHDAKAGPVMGLFAPTRERIALQEDFRRLEASGYPAFARSGATSLSLQSQNLCSLILRSNVQASFTTAQKRPFTELKPWS